MAKPSTAKRHHQPVGQPARLPGRQHAHRNGEATATISVDSVSDRVGSQALGDQPRHRQVARRSSRRNRRAACRRARRANCSKIGRSRPSLLRTAAICCAVASSPAMIAAGSPGARRSRKNTNTATTTMTGMVASSRRRCRRSWLSHLARGRCRTSARPYFLPMFQNTDQARCSARCRRGGRRDRRSAAIPLAERDVDHLLDGARLQVARDLLLLLVGLGEARRRCAASRSWRRTASRTGPCRRRHRSRCAGSGWPRRPRPRW